MAALVPLLWLWVYLGAVVAGATPASMVPFSDPQLSYFYTYTSRADLLDFDNVTTVIKFHVTPVNRSLDSSSLLLLQVDSFSLHSEQGYHTAIPQKWDWNKRFLFQREDNGEVRIVYHHPEEKEQILTLKNILAGIFALRLQEGEGSTWTYEGQELDHQGDLHHTYSAHRSNSGLTVRRFHNSNHSVQRAHEKVMELDHSGTIRSIQCRDHFKLHNDGSNAHIYRFPGENIVNYKNDEDFPTIQSSAISSLMLTHTRPADLPDEASLTGLQHSSAHNIKSRTEKVPLQKVEKKIEDILDCIALYKNKAAANRTECVHRLTQTLDSIHEGDVVALAQHHLQRRCGKDDERCEAERHLFLDLVATTGCEACQGLIVKQVLLNPDASEDEHRRALLHFIALKHPMPETVNAVKTLCLGHQDSLHGFAEMTTTQRRACLTLGALAKTLHDLGNSSEADAIVGKLETWLGLYNHSDPRLQPSCTKGHSQPILQRRRRSAAHPSDPVSHHHVMTKAVLLHSLANGQLPRSRRHIRSYLEPNRGASVWRRAAIKSLGNSTCNESLLLLFDTLIREQDPTVKLEAKRLYHRHPLRNITLKEQENLLLRWNYTYFTVSRVRRSLRDLLDINYDNGVLSVQARLPNIDWDKVVGIEQIGASFGVRTDNGLDIALAPLNSHFKVDIYDEAYVNAHVKFIGFQTNIFKVSACYRGAIEYDINVFKDFGISTFAELLAFFRDIFNSIKEPVWKAVKAFSELFKSEFWENLVREIGDFLKNLPNIGKQFLVDLKDMAWRLAETYGHPILQKWKAIIQRVRAQFEEIRNDAVAFYKTISNTVTATIPAVGKMITDGVVSIIDNLGSLARSPMQVIRKIAHQVRRIRNGVGILIGVKREILEASQFLTGKRPFWTQIGETVVAVTEDFKDLLDLTKKGFDNLIRLNASQKVSELYRTDGFLSPADLQAHAVEEFMLLLRKSTSHLEPLMNTAQPFFDIVNGITDSIKGVMNAYETLKRAVNTAQSLTDKAFGPKFHRMFPARRRKPTSHDCPSGIWPSTFGGKFSTTGIQVMLNVGSKVRSPVSGTVVRQSDKELLISPSDPGFRQYTILLANVEPVLNVTSNPTVFRAGDVIGTALRSGCMPNYIHVAVKAQGEGGEYVNPSPFLDRLVTFPQWVEECNDYIFDFIGKTADVSAIGDAVRNESDYKENVINDMEKDIEEEIKTLPEMPPVQPYRPDWLSDAPSTSPGIQLSSKDVSHNFTNMESFLENLAAPVAKNLFGFEQMTMGEILSKSSMTGDSQLETKTRQTMDEVARKLQETPVKPPETLSNFEQSRLLKDSGMPPDGGSYKWQAYNNIFLKACPDFKDSVALDQGHVCTSHEDCLGVTCLLALQVGAVRPLVKADFRVMGAMLHVALNESSHNVSLDGAVKAVQLPLPSKMQTCMNATLVVSAQQQGNDVKVGAKVTICSISMGACLPCIPVFRDLVLRLKRGATPRFDTSLSIYWNRVAGMDLATFLKLSVSFGLDSSVALHIMYAIGDALTSEIFNTKEEEDILTEDFKDVADLCVQGQLIGGHVDLWVFHFKTSFSVGPLSIGLGIGCSASLGVEFQLDSCFLSQKHKGILSPWFGGKVHGDASAGIALLKGGLRLTGYLLQTKFNVSVEINGRKFPLVVRERMDVEVVPLTLKLEGFLEASFFFLGAMDMGVRTLWKYTAPAMDTNIFDYHSKSEDKTAPTFEIRGTAHTCRVLQEPGRDVTDPAYRLEVWASDDASQVNLTYAVGTAPGGADAMNWTEMKGPTLTHPTNELSGGVRLYWTVKARNSQGLEAVAQCELPTYDKTPPEGRVDATFAISSRHDMLSGTVFVFDDSELKHPQNVSIGLSPSATKGITAWEPLTLKTDVSCSAVPEAPKPGRLVAEPLRKMNALTIGECQDKCLKHGNSCLAISFDHEHGACELHAMVETSKVKLHSQGNFETWERLTAGRVHCIQYKDLDLQHGEVYFINVVAENVLGYRSILASHGTLIDLTPPSPGNVGRAGSDTMVAHGCNATISQPCLHVTNRPNHRIIVDGPGASTVFNGGVRHQDLKYTSHNSFIRGNWDGFHDNETGIRGYTWAVGTEVCKDNVVSTRDPHAHLSGPDSWTHSAQADNLSLADGRYYLTVSAINNVVHGGPLVTTVCHSQPLVVDTSPPRFLAFRDFSYHADLQLLMISLQVEDDLSGIESLEVGLGASKYDVSLHPYTPLTFTNSTPDVTASVEDFVIPSGINFWPILRATNGASLSSSHHWDSPITFDLTPPVPGLVMDGEWGKDVDFLNRSSAICAHWRDFHDLETAIAGYKWGVGSRPGVDDIVPFTSLPRHVHSQCANVTLNHKQKYYSTVVALNSALNQQTCNASSNGALVDVTPPFVGNVHDGPRESEDIDFTSERALVQASWDGFRDPESGIQGYNVSLFLNSQLNAEVKLNSSVSAFTDHSLSLQHGDYVSFRVTAINGAGTTGNVVTDGFRVDLTPPEVDYVLAAPPGTRYQVETSSLRLAWRFSDPESGMKAYRLAVFEEHHGSKHQLWPAGQDFVEISPTLPRPDMNHTVSGLKLKDGANYYLQVTGINGALFPKTDRSPEITIDSTPPSLLKVHLGLPSEDEEEDERGRVLHADPTRLTVSWVARDPESGVHSVSIAVGTYTDPESVTGGYRTLPADRPAVLESLPLVSSSQFGSTYRVRVKVTNGAGIQSRELMSKPIYVLAGNTPGVVFDGDALFKDADFQTDATTIFASFSGFESEACGISRYEWGVGTKPFFTDVLPYTTLYVTMTNATAGFVQAHVRLVEGQTYYVTVKAVTGYNCHEEFIVATSNGIILTSPPDLKVFTSEGQSIPGFDQGVVVFQNVTNSIGVTWNVTDAVKITRQTWCLGGLAARDEVKKCQEGSHVNLGHMTLPEGRGVFLHVKVENEAGHQAEWTSAAIITDTSPPAAEDFKCTPAVSSSRRVVTCEWRGLVERESRVTSLAICLSRQDDACDLTDAALLAMDAVSWHGNIGHLVQTLSGFYVTLLMSNVVGLQRNMSTKVLVDKTPPVAGKVSIVTNDIIGAAQVPVQCQTSSSFMELLVEGFEDPESGIDVCEIALGTTEGAVDVWGFEPATQGLVKLVTGLRLPDPGDVTAVARCSNMAGLFSMATSLPVVVSTSSPLLTVWDGTEEEDVDLQTSRSLLSGRWLNSDPCPVVRAQWRVETMAGREIIPFHDISTRDTSFASEAIVLENDVTYINVIQTVDALNRTRVARSDGVAVRVKPLVPGAVRDGAGRDVDYQLPTDVLMVSWDPFGVSGSDDPMQKIKRYEVAIEEDGINGSPSYVRPFTSVGLNLSVTFVNLTLIPNEVTYFAIVRAHSEAGGMVEATSDGIKVGFDPQLLPGDIDLPEFSSSPSTLTFAWSAFLSDVGMTEYRVAVTDVEPTLPSGTFFLDDWLASDALSPQPLMSVNLDTMVTLKDLTLLHGHRYYVIVVGMDPADRCVATSAGPVLVDLTPPRVGTVTVDGAVYKDAVFVIRSSEIDVTWENFEDPESGIASCSVHLYAIGNCAVENSSSLAAMEVSEGNRATFFMLTLRPSQIYRVNVTCSNIAGKKARSSSQPILADTTPPSPGSVKVGLDWKRPIFVQNDTTRVQITVALTTALDSSCQSENILFPSNQTNETWVAQGDPFTPKAVYVENRKMYIAVGYDETLTHIMKGGMKSTEFPVVDGNYTIRFRAARAENAVTSYIFGLPHRQPAEVFFYPRPTDNSETRFNEEVDNNTTGLNVSQFSPDFGFSLSVYGWPENSSWWCLTSIRDDLQSKWEWIRLPFNPTSSAFNYTFSLSRDLDDMVPTWSINVFIGNQLVNMFRGVRLPDTMTLYLESVNNEGLAPPVNDPFAAAFSVAQVLAVVVPVSPVPDCVYGAAFSDPDFGLKELWIGVTSKENATDPVFPMTLHHSFCRPCPSSSCNIGCDSSCPEVDKWRLLQMEVTGLALIPGRGVDQTVDMDVSETLENFKEDTYYVNVRAINFAGVSAEAKSNRLMVDVSPPVFEFLSCTDPVNSLEEPVSFLGSNSSVGAIWNCQEDVSSITGYTIAVGSTPGDDDVYASASVEMESKIGLHLADEPLRDGHTYYVTVTVENSAGLSTSATCNVTVETTPPELLVDLEKSTIYKTKDLLDLHTSLTSQQDCLGVVLPAIPDPNVLCYEWGITSDGEDLFPKMKLGANNTSKLEVRNGDFFLNGQPIVGSSSHSDAVSLNGKAGEAGEGVDKTVPGPNHSYLLLEPGRCYYQTLRTVSRAHVSTSSDPVPICVKREQDTAVDVLSGATQVSFSPQSGTARRKRGANRSGEDMVTVSLKGLGGAALVGPLSPSDLNGEYGSSGAGAYRPFISPDLRPSARTSRLLARRLVHYSDVSLFVSPTPFALIENRIQIDVQKPDASFESLDTVRAPLVWNPDLMQWMQWSELCPDPLPANCTIGESPVNQRIPVGSHFSITFLYRPLHVAVFDILRESQNLPPVPASLSVLGAEDTVLETRLLVTDAEGDDVEFSLTSSGSHGTAEMNETGELRYVPDENFCGEDTLTVTAREINVPQGVTPEEVTYDVSVYITCVNDPPTLHFSSMGQTWSAQTVEDVNIVWKGRFTLMPASISLGHFVLADVDTDDELEMEHRQEGSEKVDIHIVDVTGADREMDLSLWSHQTLRVFQLRMLKPTRIIKSLKLHVICRDRQRFYSRALNVEIWFTDIFCSDADCGQFSVNPNTRDEAKPFIQFVPPTDAPTETTINPVQSTTESAPQSFQIVSNVAVRLYLVSPSQEVNALNLLKTLRSNLTSYLDVPFKTVALTVQTWAPLSTSQGFITQVLFSAREEGAPMPGERLERFVISTLPSLERALNATLLSELPPDLELLDPENG